MKTKCLATLLSVLSLPIVSYADYAAPETPPSETPLFIQHHNRIAVFTPFHQVYERIKPDAFYAGVETYLADALNRRHENYIWNSEVRMGYNLFYRGREHFTPFAGVGYVKDFVKHNHRTTHKPGIVYGSVGFLYTHECTSVFNLGLNAKLIVGGPTNEKRFDWGSPVVGIDAALPITFRFGRDRHWDIRIEPFNLYLHGSKNSQDYFGFRSTVGYRF